MSELTYEELKLMQFKAWSQANNLASRVADAFVGRKYDDLTFEERQLIIPLMSTDPLDVIVPALAEVDGVLVRWVDGADGQAWWGALAERDRKWCEEHDVPYTTK